MAQVLRIWNIGVAYIRSSCIDKNPFPINMKKEYVANSRQEKDEVAGPMFQKSPSTVQKCNQEFYI